MTKRILLIDNDPAMIQSLGTLLTKSGYLVAEAKNGKEALKIAGEQDFDLIIAGVKTPGMDGVNIFQKIREKYLQLDKKVPPEIIVTGDAENDTYRKMADLGVVDYLHKPFENARFIQVIERYLDGPPLWKRKHPRVKIEIPAQLKLADSAPGAIQTFDLSEGGAGVISKIPLPVNSLAQFSANLSGYQPALKGEARVVWSRPAAGKNTFTCGLCFTAIDMNILKGILGEINKRQFEDFFPAPAPDFLKDDFQKNYLFERFNQKQIMKIIDFQPPFLRIDRVAVLGSDRQDMLQIRGIAAGTLTLDDTAGHYNNTLFLAMYGLLVASAAQIYLAMLFPATAPQVIKLDWIKPSRDRILWKPDVKGSRFFIETQIVNKKLQMLVANTRMFSDQYFMGEIKGLKLILTAKDSIQQAKILPAGEKLPVLKSAGDDKEAGEGLDNFFGVIVPEEIKKNYQDKKCRKKLNQQEIRETIDFAPPFLKIDQLAVFEEEENSTRESVSLGMGRLTAKDTVGHYNNTVFLALCAQIMSSATAIHLAVLFPGKAPEVIAAKGVKPFERSLWKPGKDGAAFWVETKVIKKKMHLVIIKAQISFTHLPYGYADEAKVFLIPKHLIAQAPSLFSRDKIK